MRLVLILICALFTTGCAQLRAYQLSATHHRWATEAWRNAADVPRIGQEARHFQRGFKAGYVAVAQGESGRVPLLPPEHYWSAKYQNPDGHQAIEWWFDGYACGAETALSSGVQQFSFIASANRNVYEYPCAEPPPHSTRHDEPLPSIEEVPALPSPAERHSEPLELPTPMSSTNSSPASPWIGDDRSRGANRLTIVARDSDAIDTAIEVSKVKPRSSKAPSAKAHGKAKSAPTARVDSSEKLPSAFNQPKQEPRPPSATPRTASEQRFFAEAAKAEFQLTAADSLPGFPGDFRTGTPAEQDLLGIADNGFLQVQRADAPGEKD